MLNHELQRNEAILVVRLDGPLEAEDFATLTSHVDAYLANAGKLRGLLLDAGTFPGWKDLRALRAHARFVKHHHRQIGKVAVVADGVVAIVMPYLARHFMHAQIRRFDRSNEEAAWQWLTGAQARAAA